MTIHTFAKQVIAALPDAGDRDLLSRVYLERRPEALAELGRLAPDGRLVQKLFERPSPERAEAIVGALPRSSQHRLPASSPSTRVRRLKANLYVMHDRADSYIPLTHSLHLASAAPSGTLRRYTEFDLFGHVMPNRQLDTPAFARELLKLFRHAWLVGQEFRPLKNARSSDRADRSVVGVGPRLRDPQTSDGCRRSGRGRWRRG